MSWEHLISTIHSEHCYQLACAIILYTFIICFIQHTSMHYKALGRHSSCITTTEHRCFLAQKATNQLAATRWVKACRRGQDDSLSSKRGLEWGRKGIQVTLNVAWWVAIWSVWVMIHSDFHPSEGRTQASHTCDSYLLCDLKRAHKVCWEKLFRIVSQKFPPQIFYSMWEWVEPKTLTSTCRM